MLGNINKNNLSNKFPTAKPNRALEFALTIFKFYIELIEKFGIWGIDFVAARLSLSPPGKSLSKMNINELAQHFRELGQKLGNPEIRKEIMEIINNSQPVVQEAMMTIVNVATSSAKFAVSDAITFVCSDTPLAPVCGALKLVGNAENLGSELIKDTEQALDVAKKANQESREITNVLNQTPSIDTNTNANTNTKLGQTLGQTLGQSLGKSIQGGGADIHHMIQQKQNITNRINDSITKFLYTKSHNKKTKTNQKIKTKPKTRTKTKTKRRVNK